MGQASSGIPEVSPADSAASTGHPIAVGGVESLRPYWNWRFTSSYEKLPTDEVFETLPAGSSSSDVPPMRITINPQGLLNSSNRCEDARDLTTMRNHKPQQISAGSSSSCSIGSTNIGFGSVSSGGMSPRIPFHSGRGATISSDMSRVHGFSGEGYQEILEKVLQSVYGASRVLNSFEARSLALIIEQKREDSLLRALTSVAGLSTFTVNQDLFREFGVIDDLVMLLKWTSLAESSRIMVMQSIANLACNQKNQLLLKQQCLRVIVDLLEHQSCSELLKLTAFRALLNLTLCIDSEDVAWLHSLIPILLKRLGSFNIDQNLFLALKLLVNLSCTLELLEPFLISEIPSNFVRLLDATVATEEILLRSVSLVCNISATAATMGDVSCGSSADGSATTLKELLFGAQANVLSAHLTDLCSHANEELRSKSRRTLYCMAVVNASLRPPP